MTGLHSHGEVLLQEAAVTQQASPELYPDNAEDEEDKEAEQEDIPQHGQRVQQQVHQDPHTWAGEGRRDGQNGEGRGRAGSEEQLGAVGGEVGTHRPGLLICPSTQRPWKWLWAPPRFR